MSYNSGSSDYALNVYGSGDNQVAAPNHGNLIQMNNPVGGLMKGGELNSGPVKGGRRRKGSKKSKRRGGSGLGTMLVPAGLVLASNYVNRRFKGNQADNRSRRGRGFKSLMSYGGAGMPHVVGGSGSPIPMIGGTGMPPVVGGSGSPIPKMGGSGVEMPKMGGSGVEMPKMGGSTLVDIAVPAGLVYINDRYYNRKNRNTNTNRHRRTGRRTRGGRKRR